MELPKFPALKGLLIIIISRRNCFFWGHNALFVCAFVLMGAISLLDVGPLDKKERIHLLVAKVAIIHNKDVKKKWQ